MLRCAVKTASARMTQACVYRGYGMYDKDSGILHRELTHYLKGSLYTVTYITPEEIREGRLQTDVKLLAIGGGFDLGLIKVLGQLGMTQIRDFVSAGGSYLGICSGAYFACDYIEFDKGGPLQVMGERFLKFYPGASTGPLYKKYVYNSTEGAVAALIDFPMFDREVADTDLDKLAGHKSNNDKTSAKNNTKCNGAYILDHDQSRISENIIQIVGINEQTAVDTRVEMLNKNTPKTNNSSKYHIFSETGTSYSNNIHASTDPADGSADKNDVGNVQEKISMTRQKRPNGVTESMLNMANNGIQGKVFFNGGGHFIRQTMTSYLASQNLQNTSVKRLKTDHNTHSHELESDCNDTPKPNNTETEVDEVFENVTILARYLDLPKQPVAMVKCNVGKGVAVLSGAHFEYSAGDVDDEDDAIKNVIKSLNQYRSERTTIFKLVLKHLNIIL